MMRAGQIQESLDWIDELQPDIRDAIRGRCDAAHIAAITQVTRLTWVPVEYGIELTVAVHAMLGDSGLLAFGRESLLRAVERPWLRPLRDAAIRIFGLTPRGVFRFAPRVWDHIFRNCGEVSFIPGDEHSGTLVMSGYPPLVSSKTHLIAVAGGISAILDICEVHGNVWMRPMPPSENQCAFDIVWT